MSCKNCGNKKLEPKLPLYYKVMTFTMAPILKMTGMTCEDSAKLSSLNMDCKLNLKQTFQLKMHLIMCSVCRSIPKQLQTIQKLYDEIEDNLIDGESSVDLSKSVSRIEKELNERIDKIK